MNKLAVLDATNEKTPRSAIRTGKLVVNLDARNVSVDDRAVHLTGKEYDVLSLLNLHKGTVVTKEMFLKHGVAAMSFGTRSSPVRRLQLARQISTGAGEDMSARLGFPNKQDSLLGVSGNLVSLRDESLFAQAGSNPHYSSPETDVTNAF